MSSSNENRPELTDREVANSIDALEGQFRPAAARHKRPNRQPKYMRRYYRGAAVALAGTGLAIGLSAAFGNSAPATNQGQEAKIERLIDGPHGTLQALGGNIVRLANADPDNFREVPHFDGKDQTLIGDKVQGDKQLGRPGFEVVVVAGNQADGQPDPSKVSTVQALIALPRGPRAQAESLAYEFSAPGGAGDTSKTQAYGQFGGTHVPANISPTGHILFNTGDSGSWPGDSQLAAAQEASRLAEAVSNNTLTPMIEQQISSQQPSPTA